jgi:UDP-glucose 4-epimerase
LIEIEDKRVLVFGGLGFIGSNLVHSLVRHGALVDVVDNLSSSGGGRIENLNGVEGKIEIQIGDIRDKRSYESQIRRADVIVNCAADTSHAGSFERPDAIMEVNVMAILTMLEYLRSENPSARFTQIGTSTQFGRSERALSEEDGEFPLDLYSASKVAAEKVVLAYGNGKNLNCSVVRLPNVYGPRSSIRNRALTFNNYFIGLALMGEEIEIFGSGSQQRNLLYVDDSVEAIILASFSPQARNRVYLASSNDYLSVREIATAIVETVGGGTVKFVDWPDDAEYSEVGDVKLSNNRIFKELGWTPKKSFCSGLEETVTFFRTNAGIYLS